MRRFLLAVFLWSPHASSQDVKISDFRIPETRATRLLGRLQADASRTTRHLWMDFFPDASSEWNNDFFLNGRVAGQAFYDLLSINEEHTNNLTANLELSWNYRYDEQETITSLPPRTRKDRNQRNEESVWMTLEWTGRRYWESDTWYVFGAARLDGNYFLAEGKSTIIDSSAILKVSDLSRTYGYDAFLNGGVGYGKVRDGTNVFVVLRILEKLKEDGILSRDLNHEEILNLVNAYSKIDQYSMTHERFLKFFLSDVLKTLEGMGALGKPQVDSYSTLRTLEVLSERIQLRLFGWRVQGGIEHRSSQYHRVYPGISTFDKTAMDYAAVESEYGIDLSLWSHASGRFTTRLPLVPQRDRYINAAFVGRFTYELSERVEFVGSYSYTLFNDDSFYSLQLGRFRKEITHSVSAALYFFIENSVNLQIGAGYSHGVSHFSDRISARKDVNSGLFGNVGINYRFF